MTRISIILPTYNRAERLPRAIESALNQTIPEFEVLVVNDGSTDDTRSVVERYEDDRIEYMSHEGNRGPSAARNTGLAAADGQYVTFLDSDDELSPTFLETSLERLQDEPRACAGTCVTYEVQSGTAVRENRVPPLIDGMDFLVDKVPRVGGLLLRSAVVSEIGPFDEHQPYNEDVDYWIRLFRNGYYLIGIDEPLYRYHKHGDQQTADDDAIIAGLDHFFEKHEAILPADFRARYRYVLGKAYAGREEFSRAAVEFRRAIEADPRPSRTYYYYLTSKLCPSAYSLPRTLSNLKGQATVRLPTRNQ